MDISKKSATFASSKNQINFQTPKGTNFFKIMNFQATYLGNNFDCYLDNNRQVYVSCNSLANVYAESVNLDRKLRYTFKEAAIFGGVKYMTINQFKEVLLKLRDLDNAVKPDFTKMLENGGYAAFEDAITQVAERIELPAPPKSKTTIELEYASAEAERQRLAAELATLKEKEASEKAANEAAIIQAAKDAEAKAIADAFAAKEQLEQLNARMAAERAEAQRQKEAAEKEAAEKAESERQAKETEMVLKTAELEKELAAIKATNEEYKAEFEKANETSFIEKFFSHKDLHLYALVALETALAFFTALTFHEHFKLDIGYYPEWFVALVLGIVFEFSMIVFTVRKMLWGLGTLVTGQVMILGTHTQLAQDILGDNSDMVMKVFITFILPVLVLFYSTMKLSKKD